MNEKVSFRIDVEAAQALAEWKAYFAEQVAKKAKEVASNSGSEGVITLNHYRQVALAAAKELAKIVQDTSSRDGNQEAA